MREREIFIKALETSSSSERAAVLEEACGDNATLRSDIERLLAEHERQESFILDFPAAGSDGTVDRRHSERPGTIIGPYKLLQQIGEGGMGVVFMAEQTRPIQRTVAVKVIKLGMDTRQVIARFEAERQALAMMDHPNIAKALDAGATDGGRPYFVMELVKGMPITKYCDDKRLSLRARLELFIQVCQAVQHAHQKGVIHRDLKPTNVLAAEYDNHVAPKVIDFGVAKATASKLTERTMFTEFGQVVGTMEYMSPEQAKLNQLDIDTRSDIYSLGVLLYELLAGSTPLEGKRLHEAAFDEKLRIIREEDPPKPSTRLTSSDALPSIAANRSVEPLRLNKLVQGELDWIVMKALDKERNRRYETANNLAIDLQRYLADEPIEAGPNSTLYRLNKFIRRHRAGVAAGAASLAALLVGLTLAWVGLLQVRRQERTAVAQAAKATAVSSLLQQMLQTASPNSMKGAEYTVREMIADFSAGLGDQIHDQPEVEATIRATIGRALDQLGQPDDAEPQLKQALEIRRRLYGENHQDVANSYYDCANPLLYHGKFVEAEQLLRKSLAIHRALGIENGATADVLSRLGYSLYQQMRNTDAEAMYDQAYDLARTHDLQPQLATIMHVQSQLAAATPGHGTEAEQLARQSLALTRRLHGDSHPDTAWVLWTLAYILEGHQSLDEAAQFYHKSIDICREQFGESHAVVHALRDDLRRVLLTQGDKKAVAVLDAEQSANDVVALADFDKAFARYPKSPLRLVQRGNIHALRGDFEKADADLKRAAKLSPETSYATTLRAMVCLTRRDDAGFRQASQDLANMAARGADRSAAQLAAQTSVLTPDSAIEPRQAVEFAQRAVEADPQNGFTHGLLAATLYRAGRYDEAAQKFQETLNAYGDHLATTGLHAFSYLFLAMTHHRLGHAAEANDALHRGTTIIDARQGVTGFWPGSIVAERLREETQTLLGVEQNAATRDAGEANAIHAPAGQSSATSDRSTPEK